MQRKLVSIQSVAVIEPIAGADKIMKARVMGWDVVVKKEEFKPGERCVFFEIDSVLPEGADWAEFMRPRSFRVKTARLRGVLSQGLALPTTILPAATALLPIGTDLSGVLGVKKYEPMMPDAAEIGGPFPGEVPKTDEIRLQSALGVLHEMRGREFYVTTKLDGTSTTYLHSLQGDFIACSRNWALARRPGVVWRVAEKLSLEQRLPLGYALQGELCGPGIQSNRLGLAQVGFFAFSAYDVRAGRFLEYQSFLDFCALVGVPTVPIEHVIRAAAASTFQHRLEDYLQLAAGFYTGTRTRKEGVVVRPLQEAQSQTLGGRLSFKVINNEFLLKDED